VNVAQLASACDTIASIDAFEANSDATIKKR
jgi:hypothetical protein